MRAGLQSSPYLESYFRPRRNRPSRIKGRRGRNPCFGARWPRRAREPDGVARIGRVNFKRSRSKRLLPEIRTMIREIDGNAGDGPKG